MPHDLHTWLAIAQLGATLLLAPAVKLLWAMKNDIADFKVYAARTYVTKTDLRDFLNEGNRETHGARR